MEQKIPKLATLDGDDEPAFADRSLRALLALEAIVEAGEPLSLAQLADRLSTPKATLLRMLAAMERHRFLLREVDEKTYLPGPRAHALGLAALRNEVLLRRHRLTMQELVRDLGETCNLTTLDGDQVIYIDRVETSEPLRLHVQPGTHVPLHCTASGKLFLARMAPEQRRAMLERLPLTRQTDRTLTDIDLLEAELERIRVRGVGIDSEEFVRGMVAVAVPIEDDQGRCVAGLACHAPTARRSLSEMMACIPRLQQAADSLARTLGLRRAPSN
jgi:DNA-binding IclR family transcriptional regulator